MIDNYTVADYVALYELGYYVEVGCNPVTGEAEVVDIKREEVAK